MEERVSAAPRINPMLLFDVATIGVSKLKLQLLAPLPIDPPTAPFVAL